MALTKVNNSEILSDEGYQVRISRGKLTYSQHDGRYCQLEANYVPSEGILHVYLPKDHRWKSMGKDASAIASEERLLVKSRIRSCLGELSIQHMLHED